MLPRQGYSSEAGFHRAVARGELRRADTPPRLRWSRATVRGFSLPPNLRLR
jgi:hypothetical protein